jgi:hypothetical protein
MPASAERGARLRAAMDGSGIDALILLGSANVAYATGVTSPLGYAGRASAERPVAVVLLDDPVPHLFTPFLADAAEQLELDDDHLHGPAYLDVAEGVESFAFSLNTFVPRTATIAVDELTGAMAFVDPEILDAGPLLRSVRRIKVDDELGATEPGAGISNWQAMLMEMVLTAGLVSTILGTASRAQNVGPLSALAVAGYIALAGLWSSPVSGASMNPARSFGPDMALGDFSHYWVYVVGPLLGGGIAVAIAWVLRGPGGDLGGVAAAQGALQTLRARRHA